MTARTGAPNLPDPLGNDVVGERAVVPPMAQGKARMAASAAVEEAPTALAGDSLFIDAVLAQSYRHFFGPTSQPAVPPRQQVISIARLMEKLAYLKAPDQVRVREAFQFPTRPIWASTARAASRTSPIRWRWPNCARTGGSMCSPSWRRCCMT